MCRGQKKDLATAGSNSWKRAGVLRGLHRDDEIMNLGQRARRNRVVRPSPIAAVGNEPRVFQYAEVKRQSRLRGVELALQLAYAPFSVAQHFHDGKSGGIRQRVEEGDGAIEVGGITGRRGHA